jgi:phosphatidylserine decarboxylase
MSDHFFINRTTGKKEKEYFYGRKAILFLYGSSWISKTLGVFLLSTLVKFPFFSSLYGLLNNTRASAKKIPSFIKKCDIDTKELLTPIEEYPSFNAFFSRKLKPSSRPICTDPDCFVAPADGRYRFFPDITSIQQIDVKNKTFSLRDLIKNDPLTEKYSNGGMISIRLAPADYHRFHFPCACIPALSEIINGYLFSVNPIATKNSLSLLTENKRSLSLLKTDFFGDILFIEIGATNVGSINQTFLPNKKYDKGEEKGYFSIGGSAIIILFERDRIHFDNDLIKASEQGLEMKCLFGDGIGSSVSKE